MIMGYPLFMIHLYYNSNPLIQETLLISPTTDYRFRQRTNPETKITLFITLNMSLIQGFSSTHPSLPHYADSSLNLVDSFFQQASYSTPVLIIIIIIKSCISCQYHLPILGARTLTRLQFLQNNQSESSCLVWSFVVYTVKKKVSVLP